MTSMPTFGRYAEIPESEMTPEQLEGYRFLVDGPRGRLPGPYKIWVHNPKLVHAAAPLGNHFTPGMSSLTEREREILALVGEGRSNDEIADHLVISPHTVKTHVNRAMVKLDAHDRAQLVVIAYESGLLRQR